MKFGGGGVVVVCPLAVVKQIYVIFPLEEINFIFILFIYKFIYFLPLFELFLYSVIISVDVNAP